MELKPLKVYEVNNYIKRILISDPVLYNVKVEGEISNFKHHYTGHMYFTLKDDKSRIRCVMFNGDNKNLNLNLKDGMKVVITGYISVYEKDGSYQLYAKDMNLKGTGDLFLAFENLKKKMQSQGLFDESHKKKIPFLPEKIGVVTSSKGAAISDIISVIKRRLPSVDIVVYPVLVQGEKAHLDICKGLNYFNLRDDIDLVITGRGGGSIEELWAFNEEDVALAIYNLNKPVISAVGHETDFTIADFVADLRAPTPSAAGEMATPNLYELKDRVLDTKLRLDLIYKNYLKDKFNSLNILKSSLISKSPLKDIQDKSQKLKNEKKDLIKAINTKLKDLREELNAIGGKLNALSPLSTLDRGYSITLDNTKNIIKSVNSVKKDESISIILRDGNVDCKINKITVDKNYERGI